MKKLLFLGVGLCFFLLGGSCPCAAQFADNKLPKYEIERIGDSIEVINASKKTDGFWVYLPVGPANLATNVVVLLHGYGAYNPMIFGAWIRHLVTDGNIVIYPRYQKTLYSPHAKKFVPKALTGIKNAFRVMESRGVDSLLWSELDIAAHSYGGVISMNLAQNTEEYELPPIRNLMICSAGSGPLKAGILDNYDSVEANLIIVDSEHDTTVGDVFSQHVSQLTEKKRNKVYLHQRAMSEGGLRLSSHHNEPYAIDLAFDNGVRNYTAKKALRVGSEDLLDHGGYWRLFDELMSQNGRFSLFGSSEKEWKLSKKYPTLRLIVD